MMVDGRRRPGGHAQFSVGKAWIAISCNGNAKPRRQPGGIAHDDGRQ